MAYRPDDDDRFPAYVPVAQRLSNGRLELEQLAKKRGRPVAPVIIEHKLIASSFWGKAWCQHLEGHSDYANRLPRGRTYVRNGSVVDLHISQGKVEAYVAGSALYTVTITLSRLAAPRWKTLISTCAGRIGSLIGLLRGELSGEVLAVLTDTQAGLFPAPREMTLRCSCPDGADMCKHVAATLYAVGARLDHEPELFFVLRQVDQAELLSGASAAGVVAAASAKANSGKRRISASAVASVFDIEWDDDPPPLLPAPKQGFAVAKKSAKRPPAPPSQRKAVTKQSASQRSPIEKGSRPVARKRRATSRRG